MSLSVAVVMDPIGGIAAYKDTTLALLLEAQRRGHRIHYLEMSDLFVREGRAYGATRRLEVRDDNHDWFTLADGPVLELGEFDVILMRKDPPCDMEYVYATYILERAEAAGALVVNRPAALRDVNEKMAITAFPHLCAPTLVTRRAAGIRDFLAEQRDIVLKPLDGMGGSRIFRLRAEDPNISVTIEVLTDHGRRYAMAQRYLPAIAEGDKRVLLIDGEPLPQVLARIPAPGESRGNLAAGGRGEGRDLSPEDEAICSELAPILREKGLIFVGIDIIGDKLTEINVTSPTCVRELDKIYAINIGALFWDAVERRL
jgi:glutathione synthase